jgi:preprotein translocase subunit SecA
MVFAAIARKIFGTHNDRVLAEFQPLVAKINALEGDFEKLSDDQLLVKTRLFQEQAQAGRSLDELLPEAFANVRESAKRTLGQRHFDVQLLGGMVLHRGMIAEMKTGEGKTLVSTLPVYLNALAGKGAHVVTVNDYLARRDSDWMGKVYRRLGMDVGCIVEGLNDEERKAAYACDITYGTNSQFGFDYLRDHIAPKYRMQDLVQRPFHFAIVDEVDSILIDEARTPLIISGPAEMSTELYYAVDPIIPKLEAADFELDEKARQVTLTDRGSEHAEALLREAKILTDGGLYDVLNTNIVHHLNQAVRAHKLFRRDVEYIVKEGKVIIIDEFTGRMMEGRRFSDGLHQALEAKEKVNVQTENQTLASVTLQNYFRLYPKLGGMTGTALTEAAEFGEIYGLDVISIPTNVPVARIDHDDEVYRTEAEKHAAMLAQIRECYERKQPMLVGTTSIEKSEELSELLKKNGIKHEVLNARHHEREAFIVAQAGRLGAVTIATNMAGRGTDIQLGGNLEMRLRQELDGVSDPALIQKRTMQIREEIETARAAVKAAGGLFVIGSERHESRRIDNQLRGRSGRQGDPGASKFYLSLEDDLMRIFGSEKMQGLLQTMGLKDGESITHPWISRALEKAQQKVENRNFEIRKMLLKEDDVMNDQRTVVYQQRREIMAMDDCGPMLDDMRAEVINYLLASAIAPNSYPEQWLIDTLHEECRRIFGLDLPLVDWAKEEGVTEIEIGQRITQAMDAKIANKRSLYGAGLWREVEKAQLLRVLDNTWKDHLLQLDHLRQGVRLAAYAQRDPILEYKREAFNLFHGMLARMRETVTAILAKAEINPVVVEGFKQQMAMLSGGQPMGGTSGSFQLTPSEAPKMEFSGPAKEESRNKGGLFGQDSDDGMNREQRRAMKKKK